MEIPGFYFDKEKNRYFKIDERFGYGSAPKEQESLIEMKGKVEPTYLHFPITKILSNYQCRSTMRYSPYIFTESSLLQASRLLPSVYSLASAGEDQQYFSLISSLSVLVPPKDDNITGISWIAIGEANIFSIYFCQLRQEKPRTFNLHAKFLTESTVVSLEWICINDETEPSLLVATKGTMRLRKLFVGRTNQDLNRVRVTQAGYKSNELVLILSLSTGVLLFRSPIRIQTEQKQNRNQSEQNQQRYYQRSQIKCFGQKLSVSDSIFFRNPGCEISPSENEDSNILMIGYRNGYIDIIDSRISKIILKLNNRGPLCELLPNINGVTISTLNQSLYSWDLRFPKKEIWKITPITSSLLLNSPLAPGLQNSSGSSPYSFFCVGDNGRQIESRMHSTGQLITSYHLCEGETAVALWSTPSIQQVENSVGIFCATDRKSLLHFGFN